MIAAICGEKKGNANVLSSIPRADRQIGEVDFLSGFSNGETEQGKDQDV